MRTIIAILVASLFTLAAEAQPATKANLKVLYVGGTSEYDELLARGRIFGEEPIPADILKKSIEKRMKSFEKFLNDYFTSVTVIHEDDYTEAMSDNYDVTVMDGVPKPVVPSYYNRASNISRPAHYLSHDFSRPILTISEISNEVGRPIGTKHDWYCLCLYSDAFGMRTEHPIFNGPFPVKMTLVDKPTPESVLPYPHRFKDGKVPDKLPMWRVQIQDKGSEEGIKRSGLVAHPGDFESHESEIISGGHSMKCPDAVAIGRHGNFLHWGFPAMPDELTDEAKPVLANAIVYISNFNGQTPIARKYDDRAATREHINDLKQMISYEAFASQEKAVIDQNKLREELQAKQARGEQLDETEMRMVLRDPQRLPTYEAYLQRQVRGLYNQFGMDTAAYQKYFKENYDYFYTDGAYDLIVDEDAKSVGIPNNDKRILDEAIKMLESGNNKEKGERILARYTMVDFQTPAEWRKWYNTYKDKLFFTESGGWMFLVNSREQGVNDYKAYEKRRSTEHLTTAETNDAEPVAVAANVTVLRDGNYLISIKMKVHRGYYIYDDVAKGDPFTATKINIVLPENFKAIGDLNRPSSEYYNQKGTTIFQDTIVFSQEFSGNGGGELKLDITWQCCDSRICFLPGTKTITLKL